jgi:hypothetical protein
MVLRTSTSPPTNLLLEHCLHFRLRLRLCLCLWLWLWLWLCLLLWLWLWQWLWLWLWLWLLTPTMPFNRVASASLGGGDWTVIGDVFSR